MYKLFKCPCSKESYDKYDRNYEKDPLSSSSDVLPRILKVEDE